MIKNKRTLLVIAIICSFLCNPILANAASDCSANYPNSKNYKELVDSYNKKNPYIMGIGDKESLFKELLKQNVESYPKLFHIVEYGDPTYWDLEPNYKPPYKSMIIRDNL